MRPFPLFSLVGLAIVLAACLAAVIAHFAIDVLGDFLLAHDAYDHVEHGSRLVTAAGVIGVAALALLRVWCAAFAGRYRAHTEMRRLLAAALKRARHPSCGLALVMLTLMLVAGMEALDVRAAGGPDVDGATLFGGALWLGLSVSILCGIALWFFTTWTLRGFMLAYVVFHAIVRWVVLRCEAPVRARAAFLQRAARRVSPASVVLGRAAKRGPPFIFRSA